MKEKEGLTKAKLTYRPIVTGLKSTYWLIKLRSSEYNNRCVVPTITIVFVCIYFLKDELLATAILVEKLLYELNNNEKDDKRFVDKISEIVLSSAYYVR